MSKEQHNLPQFFLSARSPCFYISGAQEQKVFTYLLGEHANELHNVLTHSGFRRSRNIAYRPQCLDCSACLSIRVCVGPFLLSPSQRRIVRKNRGLRRTTMAPCATKEQYQLFLQYLNKRHAKSSMEHMSFEDYRSMIEDSTVDTSVFEYRVPAEEAEKEDRLVAVILVDQLADGPSLVYSFFDPQISKNSLGKYMVLDQILDAKARRRPYVYLGYWIPQSQKMAYKGDFHPSEQFMEGAGWVAVGGIPQL